MTAIKNKAKTITAKEIEDMYGDDVSRAVEFVTKQRINPAEEKPKKPFLKSNPSADEAENYAKQLRTYEAEVVVYKTKKDKCDEYNSELMHQLDSTNTTTSCNGTWNSIVRVCSRFVSRCFTNSMANDNHSYNS